MSPLRAHLFQLSLTKHAGDRAADVVRELDPAGRAPDYQTELSELKSAVNERRILDIPGELADAALAGQLGVSKATGTNLPLIGTGSTVKKRRKHQDIWRRTFAQRRIPFSEHYLSSGGDFGSPDQVQAAFLAAGKPIDEQQALQLSVRMTAMRDAGGPSLIDRDWSKSAAAPDLSKFYEILTRAKRVRSSLGPDAADRFTMEHLGSVFNVAKKRLRNQARQPAVTPGTARDSSPSLVAEAPPSPLGQSLMSFMNKQAKPKWVEMLPSMTAEAKKTIAEGLPLGKTRRTSSLPIGAGCEGKVYDSFTSGVGETVTKQYRSAGAYVAEQAQAKVGLMKAFPDLFADVYGSGVRDGKPWIVMEKLSPHKADHATPMSSIGEGGHRDLHRRLNSKMLRNGSVADRLRALFSPEAKKAQEYVLRDGDRRWELWDLHSGVNSGVNAQGVNKAFDPLVRAKSASLASRLRRARNQTHTHPTPGQASAGNYAKGSLILHGLAIKLENPKGTERRGYDKDGNVTWRRTMAVADYGYFHGTKARDGDAVDVFVGPNLDSQFVVVVDQMNPDGSFDESKFVMGVTTQEQGARIYLANYPRGWKLGPVSTTTVQQLKTWLAEGDTKAPFKGQLVKAAAKDYGKLLRNMRARKGECPECGKPDQPPYPPCGCGQEKSAAYHASSS